MRTNLPVTHRAYPFPAGKTLVSTTDTSGKILYCNPAFIEVSGFSQEELLGQPHNIIRHPDMPEEAFRDMWRTISSGRPWCAPVKNRRKNGDYYWVMANATPLMETGRPIGYMSVRTEASREQIAAAEQLYARMREDKAAGRIIHGLKGGRLVKRTLVGRIVEALQPGVNAKLLLVLMASLLCWRGLVLLAGQGPIPEGLIGVAVALLAWRYLSALILGPIKEVVAAGNKMAAGDFTDVLARTRRDEIGELQAALVQLNVNLKSIVGDARNQSGTMLAEFAENARGALELSRRTDAQAGSLEKTAVAMEEVTRTVCNTTDVAAQAGQVSNDAVGVSERSQLAVEDVADTMRLIQEASNRIGEITQVIDGIAFQTNILALNASVEAARAGEQGRGFAVVASEVRALAQRTTTASGEIRQLIAQSTERVDTGRRKTESARQTLSDTVNGVRRVHALLDEIGGAAREQLTAISQVNTAMTEIGAVTQKNAHHAQQMADSMKVMEELATSTVKAVQVFRINGRS